MENEQQPAPQPTPQGGPTTGQTSSGGETPAGGTWAPLDRLVQRQERPVISDRFTEVTIRKD